MTLGRALAPRDRRAITIGLLLVLPAVAYRLALVPYIRALSETRDQLSVQREALGRELALVAGGAAPPGEADLAAVLRAELPRLFRGADELAATAAFAAYVADRARSSRVLLQQTETAAPERREGGVIALRVTLRALGDLEGILTLLHGLEEGQKLVRVERFAVDQVERLGYRGGRDEEVLTFAALVVAYAVPVAP